MFLSTLFKRLGYFVSLLMLALLNGCAHWGAQAVNTPDCSQCTARTSPPPTYSSPTPEPMVETAYYTVRTGDTIYNLATHYETSVEELAQWNGLSMPYRLSAGQRILVPAGYPLPTVASTKPVPSYPVKKPKPKPVVSQPPNTTWNTAGGIYHVVEPGETLYSVAKNYGKYYLDIAQWNNIPSPYQISVGQRLLVSQTGNVTQPPSYSPPPVATTQPITQPMFDGNYYVVQPGETLYSIARRYSYAVGDIAAWNGILPPYGLSVGQRLIVMPPSGGSSPPVNPPTTIPRQPSPLPIATVLPPSGYHTVLPGETLYSIARRYGHNVSQLASWNSLQPPYVLSVGQNIIVDNSNSSSMSVRSMSYQMVPISETAPVSAGYHRVARGETLYSIAKRYGYSVSRVAQWNSLRSPYTLSVGQRLRVSPSKSSSAQNYYSTSSVSYSGSSDYHVVAPGETLYRIAKRYGVTVDQLMRWNNIYSPQSLRVGQRLQLFSSGGTVSNYSVQSQPVNNTTYYSTPAPTYTPPSVNTYSVQSSSTNRYMMPSTQLRQYAPTYTPTVQRAPRFHTVTSGETLAGIAAKYGLASHELALFNGIGQPYTIYPGQRVLIP